MVVNTYIRVGYVHHIHHVSSLLLPPGDFVILLSTGLSWYAALLLNFISALTAVIGFFVGVGIGTKSEEVNGWMLAFAAGLFIYIALVDLVSVYYLLMAAVVYVLVGFNWRSEIVC